MSKLYETSGQDVIHTGRDQNFKICCQHLWKGKEVSLCIPIKTSNMSITRQSWSPLLGLKPGAAGEGEGLVWSGNGCCSTVLPSANGGSPWHCFWYTMGRLEQEHLGQRHQLVKWEQQHLAASGEANRPGRPPGAQRRQRGQSISGEDPRLCQCYSNGEFRALSPPSGKCGLKEFLFILGELWLLKSCS